MLVCDMSSIGTPDYTALARKAIAVYRQYSASNADAKAHYVSLEPSSSRDLPPLNFDNELPKEEDRYLAGNFVDGTWVDKLESEVEGEGGLYNLAVDPAMRTPFALILPTRDYHPQSAPLRAPYLTHAYRLLVALEQELTMEEGSAKQVFVVYDCGEKSGVRNGHKCIRFYVVEEVQVPPIAHKAKPLDISPVDSKDHARVFSRLLTESALHDSNPFIPLKPHYNLIMTRDQVIFVPRTDDGFLGKEEGRWDGARLCGVSLR